MPPAKPEPSQKTLNGREDDLEAFVNILMLYKILADLIPLEVGVLDGIVANDCRDVG